MTPPAISPGLRFLLTAACLVIVVAGLRGAATILVPLALALFIAVISLPLLKKIRRFGVPGPLSILFVVLVDASALFLFGWIVSLASLEIRDELPRYILRAQEMEAATVGWFADRGFEVDVSPIGNFLELDSQRFLDIGFGVIRGATDVITTVVLVTLIFVFILAEAGSFTHKLRTLVGKRAELSRSAKIVREIQHYLAIKTLISAATGITIGVLTWSLALDFPLLWGLLAFLLNYIPNVGSIIAALPAVAVALLQVGPGMAVIVAVVYFAVNGLFGNFLEPMLVGRQLGISTLVVVLSLLFWGWVWGPIGMFLSVPLTMALKIGLENSREFRWVAYLMTAESSTQSAIATVPAAVPPPVPPPSAVPGRKAKQAS